MNILLTSTRYFDKVKSMGARARCRVCVRVGFVVRPRGVPESSDLLAPRQPQAGQGNITFLRRNTEYLSLVMPEIEMHKIPRTQRRGAGGRVGTGKGRRCEQKRS